MDSDNSQYWNLIEVSNLETAHFFVFYPHCWAIFSHGMSGEPGTTQWVKLVGGIYLPLRKVWVRQWEGLSLFIVETNKCLKAPTSKKVSVELGIWWGMAIAAIAFRQKLAPEGRTCFCVDQHHSTFGHANITWARAMKTREVQVG